MVPPGEWIQYEGKRKRFLVVDHLQTRLVVRPGLDYEDGRNYDEHPGTRLKDTSGRYRTVLSSTFVKVVRL